MPRRAQAQIALRPSSTFRIVSHACSSAKNVCTAINAVNASLTAHAIYTAAPRSPRAPACPTVWRGLGLADGAGGRLVEAQAMFGHGVDLAAQALGAGGEVRRLAAQRQQRLAPSRASRSYRAARDCRRIQLPTTGSEVFHMLKAGSSVRATPSTTTMVFCSSTSSGRVSISNSSVTSNSSVSSWPWKWSRPAGRGSARRWRGSPARTRRHCACAAHSRPRNGPPPRGRSRA